MYMVPVQVSGHWHAYDHDQHMEAHAVSWMLETLALYSRPTNSPYYLGLRF